MEADVESDVGILGGLTLSRLRCVDDFSLTTA